MRMQALRTTIRDAKWIIVFMAACSAVIVSIPFWLIGTPAYMVVLWLVLLNGPSAFPAFFYYRGELEDQRRGQRARKAFDELRRYEDELGIKY